ncbi:MAG TPA: DCC1-like thiol-disulfide oxidoreductase family protein [Acidimicrobiales bacterium]|nr:DCC1-like thiol-disulfide oxidoreductase family protein [Acidimicrobiales bacterium]
MVEFGAPVLIYDGDCDFCTRSARWAGARWAGARRPVARASQSLDDAALAAMSLTRDDVMRAAWWLEDGCAFEGHMAIAKALAAGRGPWRFAGVWLGRRPIRWLGAVAYPVVVRYRGSLARGPVKCSRERATPLGSSTVDCGFETNRSRMPDGISLKFPSTK